MYAVAHIEGYFLHQIKVSSILAKEDRIRVKSLHVKEEKAAKKGRAFLW
jgi:hypothetical protein